MKISFVILHFSCDRSVTIAGPQLPVSYSTLELVHLQGTAEENEFELKVYLHHYSLAEDYAHVIVESQVPTLKKLTLASMKAFQVQNGE